MKRKQHFVLLLMALFCILLAAGCQSEPTIAESPAILQQMNRDAESRSALVLDDTAPGWDAVLVDSAYDARGALKN